MKKRLSLLYGLRPVKPTISVQKVDLNTWVLNRSYMDVPSPAPLPITPERASYFSQFIPHIMADLSHELLEQLEISISELPSIEWKEGSFLDSDRKMLRIKGKFPKLDFGPESAVVRVNDNLGIITKVSKEHGMTIQFQSSFATNEIDTVAVVHSLHETQKLLDLLQNKSSRLTRHLDQLIGLRPLSYDLSGWNGISKELNVPLTDRQSKIIAAFRNLESGIQLLQGPPGTGKTSTIFATVLAIRKATPNTKIWIAAPSNAAIGAIADKFHEHAIQFALLGTEEKTSDHLKPYILKTTDRLTEFDLVLSTLSRCTIAAASLNPDVLIIDECGKATEPQTLLGFSLDPKKVLLVGDHQQLKPVVKYPGADSTGWDRSLFERLIKLAKTNGRGTPRLNVNFRMPAESYAFSNEKFYDNSVSTHNAPKPLIENTGLPLENIQFFHVDALENSDARVNKREAHTAIRCLELLNRRPGIDISKDVVILTPYNQQKNFIETLLKRDKELKNVNVMTIDSSQGREWKVVILSLVRASLSHSIGFLDDPNRLNVALTRSKDVMIILGNKRKLSKKPSIVKDLIDHLKDRESITSLSESIRVPIARSLLSEINSRYDWESYFQPPVVGPDILTQIKQITADFTPLTYQTNYVMDAVSEFTDETISDEWVPGFSLFFSRKYSAFDEFIESQSLSPSNPLTLFKFASKILNSRSTQKEKDGAISRLGQIERASIFSEKVKFYAKLFQLSTLYHDDLHAGYQSLKDEFFNDDISFIPLYYQWGLLLKSEGFHTHAKSIFKGLIEESKQDGFQLHAGNCDALYGAYCALAELVYDSNINKAENYLHEANKIERTIGRPKAWAWERLAGLYLEKDDFSRARDYALMALLRNPGHVFAYHLYIKSNDQSESKMPI